MAKTNQPSAARQSNLLEPEEVITDEVMHDPAMSGLKDDKGYTRFNANVITEPGGVIPDIPEQTQNPINVDFTKDSTGHADDNQGDFLSDPDDQNQELQASDIADDTKVDLAVVANELMFVGLDLLNDFIVKKLVINENKLKEMAIAGEISFEIITIKAQFGASYIFDMQEFLNDNEQKTRKALEFTNAEKKHISKLLEQALKSKKFKMSPEWAIVASLAGHYGAAIYTLFMNNVEVMKMVQLVSERFEGDKEMAREATKQVRQSAKKAAATPTPSEPVKPEPVETIEDITANVEIPVSELREPGETTPSNTETPPAGKQRNGKRVARIPELEEAEIVK